MALLDGEILIGLSPQNFVVGSVLVEWADQTVCTKKPLENTNLKF